MKISWGKQPSQEAMDNAYDVLRNAYKQKEIQEKDKPKDDKSA